LAKIRFDIVRRIHEMLKLIVYLVLGFYSTYMEVVQLVSKIRIFKIIPVSNQLPT